jgi:hypothetical protein
MPIAVPASPRSRFVLTVPLFVGALLCMFLAEAFTIHGLWFRTHPSTHPNRGLDVLFLAWIPAFAACLLLVGIRRLVRSHQLSASLASTLSSGIGLLLLIAYLLISRLAQLAFR